MFRSTITTWALFLALAAASAYSVRKATELQPVLEADSSQVREMRYLPSGRGLHALSFGYTNSLAHFLWFNTISYFGKHHRGDQNYLWLSHMCNLVADLNPRARHVHDFCSTMLAWEAQRPDDAVELLSKAIRNEPDNWFLYYQRGFIYMFFLRESERAQADFLKSAELPNAHILVKRLAARKLVASDNAAVAVEFLAGMLRTERDPSAREALEARWREARYEFDLQSIEKARDAYRDKFGRWPPSTEELSHQTAFAFNLQDPFGGTYQVDPESGHVSSTSGRKRLVMYQARN